MGAPRALGLPSRRRFNGTTVVVHPEVPRAEGRCRPEVRRDRHRGPAPWLFAFERRGGAVEECAALTGRPDRQHGGGPGPRIERSRACLAGRGGQLPRSRSEPPHSIRAFWCVEAQPTLFDNEATVLDVEQSGVVTDGACLV